MPAQRQVCASYARPFEAPSHFTRAAIIQPLIKHAFDVHPARQLAAGIRRGQKTFRDQLLKSNPLCAVTGCELLDILEAAHIDAYRNDSHNHISNELLLRSDIHTLFDLGLVAINSETIAIVFSKIAKISGYEKHNTKKPLIKHTISMPAIINRWNKLNKENQ
ncbi:TPA: HNH endonuclease [Enterobacter cloacae]|nr:HNH endonuclease [Enterobacter pasteurii]